MNTKLSITPDMAGCWLSSGFGWHNNYDVVDIAITYGMKLDAADQAALTSYKLNQIDDADAIDRMINQGGLVDAATEYLDEIAPYGYTIHWHDGELFMSLTSELEGDSL